MSQSYKCVIIDAQKGATGADKGYSGVHLEPGIHQYVVRGHLTPLWGTRMHCADLWQSALQYIPAPYNIVYALTSQGWYYFLHWCPGKVSASAYSWPNCPLS